MPVDMFLKIDGIEGECQKKGHEKEIDIYSFSLGMTQQGSFGSGGAGGGTGKAQISDISFTKQVDKASGKLYAACAAGKHIKEVTVVAQKAGDGSNPLVYYKIKLEDVIVSGVHNSGATAGDAITESVVFNCAKFTFDYQAQGKDGGKDGGVVTASYDARTNTTA